MKLFSTLAGLAVLAGILVSPLAHAASTDNTLPRQAEKATPSDMNYHGKMMDAAGKPLSNKSSVLGSTRSQSLSMAAGVCDVVGNPSSKIYHRSGSTMASKLAHPVCFKNSKAAENAGYRKASNAK